MLILGSMFCCLSIHQTFIAIVSNTIMCTFLYVNARFQAFEDFASLLKSKIEIILSCLLIY